MVIRLACKACRWCDHHEKGCHARLYGNWVIVFNDSQNVNLCFVLCVTVSSYDNWSVHFWSSVIGNLWLGATLAQKVCRNVGISCSACYGNRLLWYCEVCWAVITKRHRLIQPSTVLQNAKCRAFPARFVAADSPLSAPDSSPSRYPRDFCDFRNNL